MKNPTPIEEFFIKPQAGNQVKKVIFNIQITVLSMNPKIPYK